MEFFLNITVQSLKKLSQNLSILYVEDDTTLRNATKTIFENLFKRVDIATDGIDGLSKYTLFHSNTKKHYDIVISDIKMPGLDGIELTKKIFAINNKQKIIITSAHDDKKYLIDLINIGVEAFMEKPMTSNRMINVLYSVCFSFISKEVLVFKDNYTYLISSSNLFLNDAKVQLSDNESKLLKLLVVNNHQAFNCIDIFNHLYFDEPEKEFSQNSIKSLVKRLRKKIPENFIRNTQKIGYSVNFDI